MGFNRMFSDPLWRYREPKGGSGFNQIGDMGLNRMFSDPHYIQGLKVDLVLIRLLNLIVKIPHYGVRKAWKQHLIFEFWTILALNILVQILIKYSKQFCLYWRSVFRIGKSRASSVWLFWELLLRVVSLEWSHGDSRQSTSQLGLWNKEGTFLYFILQWLVKE